MKIQLYRIVLLFLLATILAACGGGVEVEGCLLGMGPDCPDSPTPAPIPPDTTPPSVSYHFPGDNATWVNINSDIVITFKNRVDRDSINASTIYLSDQSGKRMSGTHSYSDLYSCSTSGCGYNARFSLSSPLDYGTTYTATVTTGVSNQSGGASLVNDHQWSFTTLPLGLGEWKPTATTGAPSVRYNHTAIWTGSEMIIWGGSASNAPDSDRMMGTGGRYDPLTDTWRATSTSGSPEPRSGHTAVWTGSEMIIWGGSNSDGGSDTGGRYDPNTDSWRDVSRIGAPTGVWKGAAVWTGSEMIVWGLSRGAIYEPVSDTWRPISTTDAPQSRGGFTAVWTGTEMITWGSNSTSDSGAVTFTNVGGRYDPVTDTWQPLSVDGAPDPRDYHSAVWTGTEMIIWGGWDTEAVDTGGVYELATDTWEALAMVGAPPRRSSHTAIWTGSEMIVWGGSFYRTTGARYNPAAENWVATSNLNLPPARGYHTAVWTGAEMIIWGGNIPQCCNVGTNTGGRYTP